MSTTTSDDEALALGALEWLLATARPEGDGLGWAGVPSSLELDPTLYSGGAGVVLALLEAHAHVGDDRWADAASRGGRLLAAHIDSWEHASLYFGTAGMTFTLHAVAEQLGDADAGRAAAHGLERIRTSFDGERWGPQFELLGGNAGIALTALALDDVDLAEQAVTPYLRTAETTRTGVTWENRIGMTPRRHHISHGTLGVAYALAATAHATGRSDLWELAMAAVDDVVSRNDADPDGFLVAHSDPQQDPDRIERYSFGWCHGPAGDAQVFRLLHQLTDEERWLSLQERCWRSVIGSGLPRRVRPGFWDNSGRCCGTAGVLALACDRAVETDRLALAPETEMGPGTETEFGAETGGGQAFATVLVTDLRKRATVDADGARWSNVEHRATPSTLEPRQGWGMGNAGIIRELLRYVRVSEGRDPSYAVPMPDHPTAQRPPTRAQ